MSETATSQAGLSHRMLRHLTVLRRNLEVLELMVDGVDEASADRPLVAGSSTLRWLLGHLIDTRDLMLRHLQCDPVLEPEQRERYGRGTDAAAIGPGEPPLAALLALARAQQERLEHAFAAAGEEILTAPSGDRTCIDELEFLVWHDTYHIGQTTLYRRAAGLASPIG